MFYALFLHGSQMILIPKECLLKLCKPGKQVEQQRKKQRVKNIVKWANAQC